MLFLGDVSFKMHPPTTVPKCLQVPEPEKAVMCLTEKMHGQV